MVFRGLLSFLVLFGDFWPGLPEISVLGICFFYFF